MCTRLWIQYLESLENFYRFLCFLWKGQEREVGVRPNLRLQLVAARVCSSGLFFLWVYWSQSGIERSFAVKAGRSDSERAFEEVLVKGVGRLQAGRRRGVFVEALLDDRSAPRRPITTHRFFRRPERLSSDLTVRIQNFNHVSGLCLVAGIGYGDAFHHSERLAVRGRVADIDGGLDFYLPLLHWSARGLVFRRRGRVQGCLAPLAQRLRFFFEHRSAAGHPCPVQGSEPSLDFWVEHHIGHAPERVGFQRFAVCEQLVVFEGELELHYIGQPREPAALQKAVPPDERVVQFDRFENCRELRDFEPALEVVCDSKRLRRDQPADQVELLFGVVLQQSSPESGEQVVLGEAVLGSQASH